MLVTSWQLYSVHARQDLTEVIATKSQRESNMHRIEVHSRHLLPPISRWGNTVDSYKRSCRNSRTSHRKGGVSGTGKGPIPLREHGGECDKMVTMIWCMLDSPLKKKSPHNFLLLWRASATPRSSDKEEPASC